jgi:membrane fusion protein, multidrug efflux system
MVSARETIESETRNLQLRPLEPNPPGRKGRWWIWLVVLAVLGAAVWYFRGVAASEQAQKSHAGPHGGAQQNETVPVVVASARTADLPIYLNGLGTVTAFNTVTIHTRVDGQIMSVAFKEGQFVHQGDPLVEIDPRPYQVMLAQAEGQLAKDEAALHDATIDFGRDKALVEAGIISKQQLDTQTATMQQGEGAVKADQAQIDNAKLDLVYCRITAPITGRIGLRLVDPGNIVHASDTGGLIVITQLQPIAVIFTLPEDQLAEVYQKIRGGETLRADAYDRNDTTKIAAGTLLAMDNQIDPTTGTYKLKAVFDNSDNALFPNQFVNIHLLVDTKHDLTVVPVAAIQRGPQGTYVYSVEDGNVARIHSVTLAVTSGNEVGLSSGVQPGDSVIVDGAEKLQDGSKIEVRSSTGGPARASDTAQPATPAVASGHGHRRGSADSSAPGKKQESRGPQTQ